LLEWLMTPEAPDVPLTLEAFLQPPAWHCGRLAAAWGTVRSSGARRPTTGRHGSLCDSCLVRQECLEAALADPDQVGLWGGTTERERRAMGRGKRGVRSPGMCDYTDVSDAFVEARIAGQDASDLEDAYMRSDFSRIIPALQIASSAHHRAADKCDQLIEKLSHGDGGM
jgi:WhiB family redox-sensing transcriptional regulator